MSSLSAREQAACFEYRGDKLTSLVPPPQRQWPAVVEFLASTMYDVTHLRMTGGFSARNGAPAQRGLEDLHRQERSLTEQSII